VAALRNDLLQGGLDSFQTAELIKIFLTGLGYGVSPQSALMRWQESKARIAM
jgi:hypothetical protein